ncbi:hypothetical protein Ppa06_65340 [Planomonospora parontospora subsp. parontospora]|uniref:PIN domain-containing protein n=2 Tax=Planomonospora parontospora TaxID=58119 RepID=A0AA37BN89_9ACTN|nr:hypothetical protein [Planomonospora parontospora]GGK96246.1 hypothetical protein GCM10010126_64600 [Planomonospora parontospora]GII12736.1 hypothetical protein Ppa06_65340 [Planomonospora parontospora subsp. parontospora]
MSDFTPAPHILDSSVLTDVARGDGDLIGFLQDFDRAGQPLVIPSLAAAGALLDSRGLPDAQALLAGLAAFERATVAPLDGIHQAAKLTDMMAVTGLDPWDAHAAAIADVAVCPIFTLDAAKWREPSRVLDRPLHVIEIADPDR